MKQAFISLAAVGLAFFGGHAGAGDLGASPSAKRQVIKECMAKRMAADRSVSYNAMLKACRERLKTQGGEMASSGPVKQ